MPERTPPQAAQRFLGYWLAPRQRDMVLGDLDEMYVMRLEDSGQLAADLGYWWDALVSAPQFLIANSDYLFSRRFQMTNNTLVKAGWGSALLSLLFLLPALLLVSFGAVYSFGNASMVDSLPEVPVWANSAGLVLGGIILAVLINLLAVAHLRFESDGDLLRGTLEVRKRTANLVLLGLTLFASLVILLYLVVENLGVPV